MPKWLQAQSTEAAEEEALQKYHVAMQRCLKT
jgi:hypothetical protein